MASDAHTETDRAANQRAARHLMVLIRGRGNTYAACELDGVVLVMATGPRADELRAWVYDRGGSPQRFRDSAPAET